MGLWDRIWGRHAESRRGRDARALERAGDLAGAVEAFLGAGMQDEAARVLLMRADAEGAMDKRLAFLAEAARVAADDGLAKAARRRKALLAFDLVKARGGSVPSELAAVGRDLEEVGEHEVAADAFALAGDREGEARALTAAGAIDRLEARLSEAQTEARHDRDLTLLLRKLDDLDRTGERRAALQLASEWLERHVDERVEGAARAIRARVLRGPLCELEVGGVQRRYALGDEITVGRADATIVVASRAISRRHLRVYRGASGPMVEDLGTRNGTTLAGARLSAALPVGQGLELSLGGEVPCKIAVEGVGVSIELAGEKALAPLGPLVVGPLEVALSGAGGDEGSFVVVTCRKEPRPYLGDYRLSPRLELALGDVVKASKDGEIILRAIGDGERRAP
jgi:hypothetical protein